MKTYLKVRGFEKISYAQWELDYKLTDQHVEFLRPEAIYDGIKLPKRATKGSAGYDFFAPYAFDLYPGEETLIPLGIRVFMQQGEVLEIYPRSGLGFKFFIRLANTAGIIDSDYYNAKNEGHIWLKIRNESPYGSRKVLDVENGEAICQGIFIPFLLTDYDSFDVGEQRTGGFGSTSK